MKRAETIHPNIDVKKVVKQRACPPKPGDPRGAIEHTSQKIKDKLILDKPINKSKPRRTLTRPGRLRARSGYIGGRVPLGFAVKPAGGTGPKYPESVWTNLF